LNISGGLIEPIYVKDFPSESIEEYEVNPCLIDILHKQMFAGDDPDEDPYDSA
jgi:hypothetical protein